MASRGGLGEMMRQAQRLQRKIEARKDELQEESVEASAGNDQVKVTVTCGGKLTQLSVAEELLQSEDLEMLQDLIIAATNAGLEKARERMDSELEKVSGGLKLPGM